MPRATTLGLIFLRILSIYLGTLQLARRRRKPVPMQPGKRPPTTHIEKSEHDVRYYRPQAGTSKDGVLCRELPDVQVRVPEGTPNARSVADHLRSSVGDACVVSPFAFRCDISLCSPWLALFDCARKRACSCRGIEVMFQSSRLPSCPRDRTT